MNHVGAVLFSLVFVAIGAGLLAYAMKVSAKARQSLSWPSIEGEIAHSALLFRSSANASTDNTPMYKADVSYRYKVKGVDYSSSRISLMDMSSTGGRAQGIVERYPSGSMVPVYYNPSDPSDAVLEPGGAAGIGVLKLIGAIFALAGFVFLVGSLTGHVRTGP